MPRNNERRRPGPDTRMIARLRQVRAKGVGASYCVVGAGHGGLAMAGHLGILGYPVNLFNRTDEKLDGVRWHGGIKVGGAVSGFGPVKKATSDMREALEGVDVVMVVTPSTAHRGLALVMAPYLTDGQMVVLNPGRTGGALELRKVFQDSGHERIGDRRGDPDISLCFPRSFPLGSAHLSDQELGPLCHASLVLDPRGPRHPELPVPAVRGRQQRAGHEPGEHRRGLSSRAHHHERQLDRSDAR